MTNNETQAVPPSKFLVHLQYVKDISFENPNTIMLMAKNSDGKPDINIGINVSVKPIAEKMYEVLLELRADAKKSTDVVFICEVKYAGLISTEELDQEKLKAILLEDCPQFLFPFARKIVADMTAESGFFPPLILQPVDFSKLHKSQQQQQQNSNENNNERQPIKEAAVN